MRAEYREEPCRNALNRVRGMPFAWSLNPYMGCAHRCTFCYVRAFEHRGHPVLELARQRLLAESTDAQGGEGDAELHRGDEAARVARDPQDVPGPAVPLMLELDDPGAARRDEAVFGRHEERVEQDQDGDPDQLEKKRHALSLPSAGRA